MVHRSNPGALWALFGLFMVTLIGYFVFRLTKPFFIRRIYKLIYEYPRLFKLSTSHDPPLASIEDINRARINYSNWCEILNIPEAKQNLHAIENISILLTDNSYMNIRIYHTQKAFEYISPVIAFFHGGGWILGDTDTNANLCKQISECCGCTVISVNYRLAPENRYPVPLNDCYDALNWISKSGSVYGYDGDSIILCGVHSGGNLAAALSLKARDESTILLNSIKGQILIYPALDFNFTTQSYKKYKYHPAMTANLMKSFWKYYIAGSGKKEWGVDPYESPMRGSTRDIPPTLLLLAEHDVLFDEGVAYGKRLRQSEVSARTKSYPTAHGFLCFGDLTSHGRDALQEIRKFVQEFSS